MNSMRSIALCAVLCFFCRIGFAQHEHQAMQSTQAMLFEGIGNHHHPVSTKNPEAQEFCDQGLTLVYGFNHDEAIRSFRKAAELDPNLAMAYWGIAYALGPNINLPAEPEQLKAAYEALQEARALAQYATDNERAYIEALAKRYSMDTNADLKQLAVDFKNAMGDVVRRFPDDLDAATIYAESMMNLHPWQLWSADGKPAEGTEEIIAVLKSVLKRDQNHVGANHYYIHTVEASPHPEWALPSAERLKTLVPMAGHLVHMPAHVFMRTGDYAAASQANVVAAEADRKYIEATGVQGVYPLMYYSHNLHFLAVARALEGRFADAMRAAIQLDDNINPAMHEMPMLEMFSPTRFFVLVRFRKWDDILKQTEPDRIMVGTRAVWRFGRGMAYAGIGKVKEAEKEQKEFRAAVDAVPADAVFLLNSAKSVLAVGEHLLAAKIAEANGDKNAAIDYLKKAVEAEDALSYDEPPGWYIPVRESLGGLLLRMGIHAEAEQVFRADLEKNPRSGRSLFGLRECLKAQGRTTDAGWVDTEFQVAWKNADTKLRVEDL